LSPHERLNAGFVGLGVECALIGTVSLPASQDAIVSAESIGPHLKNRIIYK
jgi:hypothetical protein